MKVLGLDPVSEPTAVLVLGRIGYLAEQPDLPGWMRVAELLRYTQAFYPQWDAMYAGQLLGQFGLDVGARINTLSKGQRARLGLIGAEAHRPDLLVFTLWTKADPDIPVLKQARAEYAKLRRLRVRSPALCS